MAKLKRLLVNLYYFKSETLTNSIMEKISDFDYSEIVEINEKKYKIELKKDN